MKRILFLAVALGLVGLLLADDVYAHGGSFRGPNGGVPPGMREPSDPEPPPLNRAIFVIQNFRSSKTWKNLNA